MSRWCLLLALLLCAAPHRAESGPTFSDAERRLIASLSPLPAPPPDSTNRWADDPVAAQFGARLFFDRRLSSDNSLSCASCHDPARNFSDGLVLARGRRVLTRNTPSLWNVAWQRWLFWDGRADSLWAQAIHPIEQPDELALERAELARRIAGHDDLRRDYEAIFGTLEPPPHSQQTRAEVLVNVAKALAAFQRRLVTAPAPFDQFAAALAAGAPVEHILSPSAQRGLRLFIGQARCVLCHSGPTFSDGRFHATLMAQTSADAGRAGAASFLAASEFHSGSAFSDDPQGEQAQRRQQILQMDVEWGQFRTPGLRNVSATAPYMHAGQFATLAQVIEHYSQLHGLAQDSHRNGGLLIPLHLEPGQKQDIEAFLHSLTSPVSDPWLLEVLERFAQ